MDVRETSSYGRSIGVTRLYVNDTMSRGLVINSYGFYVIVVIISSSHESNTKFVKKYGLV